MQRFAHFVIHIALLLAGLWSTYGVQLWSQERTPNLPTSFEAELASLTSRAAVVMVGQVVSTERHGGVMAITFRVDQAVAGEVGSTYVLREWAGLWPQGEFRYAVGDRALVFVHGLSAAGFSSPVDGAEGFVPVVVQGADKAPLIDTRRLASTLQRFPGRPLATPPGGTMTLASAVASVQAEIARELGTGHGPAKLPVQPVGIGIAGYTGGTFSGVPGSGVPGSGVFGGRPALGPEPVPILRPGPGHAPAHAASQGVAHGAR